MVVFSCDGCGDMLKKNQVDVHASRCRRCDSVSCVDCSVSFFGDDYRSHTSCISEAERYEKTVYRGSKKAGKRSPQEAWMQLIVSAASTAPKSIQHNMELLATLDNVPRKEKQFRNFAANSLKLPGRDVANVVDAMWKHLCQCREREKKDKQIGPQQGLEQDVNEDAKEQSSGADGAKLQLQATHAEGVTGAEFIGTKPAFEVNKVEKDLTGDDSVKDASRQLTPKMVSKAVKKILKKAPQRTMKMKQLRRSVRDKLMVKRGEGERSKELKRILLQQLQAKSELLKLDGKLVSLR